MIFWKNQLTFLLDKSHISAQPLTIISFRSLYRCSNPDQTSVNLPNLSTITVFLYSSLNHDLQGQDSTIYNH